MLGSEMASELSFLSLSSRPFPSLSSPFLGLVYVKRAQDGWPKSLPSETIQAPGNCLGSPHLSPLGASNVHHALVLAELSYRGTLLSWSWKASCIHAALGING